MISCFIFDIDNTLSDTSHRQHLALAKQWDEFYGAQERDPAFFDTVQLLKGLNEISCVKVMTGRPDKYREVTERWLKNALGFVPELYMRPTNKPFVKDAIVKKELYNKYIYGKYNVLGVFEDRNQCVEMWRDLGLTCYQPRIGDF